MRKEEKLEDEILSGGVFGYGGYRWFTRLCLLCPLNWICAHLDPTVRQTLWIDSPRCSRNYQLLSSHLEGRGAPLSAESANSTQGDIEVAAYGGSQTGGTQIGVRTCDEDPVFSRHRLGQICNGGEALRVDGR